MKVEQKSAYETVVAAPQPQALADGRTVVEFVGKTLAHEAGVFGGLIRMKGVVEGYDGQPQHAFSRAKERARATGQTIAVVTILEAFPALPTLPPSSPSIARRTDWVVDVESGRSKPVSMDAKSKLSSAGVTVSFVNPDGSSSFINGGGSSPFGMAGGPQAWLASGNFGAPPQPIRLT